MKIRYLFSRSLPSLLLASVLTLTAYTPAYASESTGTTQYSKAHSADKTENTTDEKTESDGKPEEKEKTERTEETLKGTWLSFVDMEELLKGRNRQEMGDMFGKICDKIKDDGGNAIFVHVRSHNDAIYPSSIYPWSCHMLTGQDPGYDPLKDMIEIAHKKGLKLHAWINPYGYRKGQISEHPELSTEENILKGVSELLKNYEIDGIHFDDYFPPIGAEKISSMILKVHKLCNEKEKPFGIAPQGNIQNNLAAGIDVSTWLSEEGYIDYIAPQIYWTDYYGAPTSVPMSSAKLKEWASLNKAGIPMYVGMPLYRAGNIIPTDPGWMLYSDNLARQAKIAKELGYKGYILYNTKSELLPNDRQKTELEELKKVKW